MYTEDRKEIIRNKEYTIRLEMDEKKSLIFVNDEIIWEEHISIYKDPESQNTFLDRKASAYNCIKALLNPESHNEISYFIGSDDILDILRGIGNYMTFKESTEADFKEFLAVY